MKLDRLPTVLTAIFLVMSLWSGILKAEGEETYELQAPSESISSDGPNIEVPQIDDSNLQRLVRRILRQLDRAVDGSVMNVRRFFRLINELFRTIGEYFGLIDRQIQSSQCNNRSCSDYGTKD